jgi:hypothetical protein
MSCVPDHIKEEAEKWGKIGTWMFAIPIIFSFLDGIIQLVIVP